MTAPVQALSAIPKRSDSTIEHVHLVAGARRTPRRVGLLNKVLNTLLGASGATQGNVTCATAAKLRKLLKQGEGLAAI
jgi:hypothetical protein